MGQPAGLIYGDVGTTRFNFIVEDPTLQKFDYISTYHKEGTILAQVTEIKRISDLPYESIKALYGNGDNSPKRIESSLTARAEVIGYRDERGLLQTPRTPFEIGQPVYKAEESLVRKVLGLYADEKAGAYIGLLKGHDIPVYLSIDTLVQKHVCILAKTGAGKSYACGVLIEELLKKKIPVVIIDTHGEYPSLAHPNKNKKELKLMERFRIKPRGYASQIVEYSPFPRRKGELLRLNGVNLEAREILDLLSAKLTGPQIGVLYQAIKELKEFKETYTLRDIIERVSLSKSNAKWNVMTALDALNSTGILSDQGIPPQDIVKKGRCSIINLKGVPPDVQEIVVARLTKELFDARKAGLIPPFMYIVEEAHNYCPERGFGNAISSQILRTVASEGRKFGMGLCVVSQRPAKVDKNVISQCNTHLILKVTNPNDVRAIIQSVEGLTTDTADEIQRLQVGVALVSGGSLAKPVMVEIRVRETDHGGRSAKIISGEESPIDFRATKMKREELPQIPAPAMTGSAQQVKKEKPKKAEIVHRVANRLGWVSTDDPNETISILSKEAKKMGEDPFKYLHTLAKLGEKFCKEENPNCIKCPMRDRCRYRLTRVSEIL